MKKVLVIQPLLPKYRIAFFNKLGENFSEFRYIIQSSQPWRKGLLEAAETSEINFVTESVHTISFFGDRFFYQKLKFPRDFGKGDVLVISGNMRYLNLFKDIVKARRRGVGIVWWSHGLPAKLNFKQKIKKYLIGKLSDVILFYNETEVASLVNNGADKQSVFALGNSLDTEKINIIKSQLTEDDISAFKEKNNLTGKKILLFLSRLTRKAMLEVAAEAMVELKKRFPDIVYVVIGSGEFEDFFKKSAAKFGVADNFLWIGSIYDEEHIAKWHLASDLYVYPGDIGLSLIHSLCYDLPVVVHSKIENHGPEYQEFVEGRNGLTFEYNNAKSLVERIIYFFENADVRERLRNGAENSVNNKFSIAGMADNFHVAVTKAHEISLTK